MASWVILERDDRPGRRSEPRFVADRFTLLGFLFPPVWLLVNRLWIEAVAAIAVLLAAVAAGSLPALWPAGLMLTLAVSTLVGLEGNAFRIEALQRRGWTVVDVIDARNLHDAETRYAFGADEDPGSVPVRLEQPPAPGSEEPRRAGPSFDLLLNPGS